MSVLATCIWIWIILLMEQLNEIWMIDELSEDDLLKDENLFWDWDGITVIWGCDSFILWCGAILGMMLMIEVLRIGCRWSRYSVRC